MRVARAEGTRLVQLGEAPNDYVNAVAAFDDGHATRPALYAGGWFGSAGGFHSPHLARWADGATPPAESYCTPETTSNGCQALISSTGELGRCAGSGFELSVAGVESQKLGIVFFGLTATATHWGQGSSFVCIAPPTTRASTQNSGGSSGGCDGSFLMDFNAWMFANSERAPAPGDTAHFQAWIRDPASPKGTSLSDALRVEIAP